MNTNPLTPTPTTNNFFGLSNAEWNTIHAEVIAEREANAFVENDAVRFFSPAEEEAETYNKFVEECGGL